MDVPAGGSWGSVGVGVEDRARGPLTGECGFLGSLAASSALAAAGGSSDARYLKAPLNARRMKAGDVHVRVAYGSPPRKRKARRD